MKKTREPLAIFTIVQNEPTWLPIWYRHYASQLDSSHLYVLNHDSTGPGETVLRDLQARSRMQTVPVHRHFSFDHDWLCETVQCFQRFLLQSYDAVLFVEVDEFVAPAPGSGYDNLESYSEKVLSGRREFVRCLGYEVVHRPEEEPPLDWSAPLLAQRNWWYRSELYSKALLSKTPLQWRRGFHKIKEIKLRPRDIDSNLLLLHLHKIDFDFCIERHREAAARSWSPADLEAKAGYQNLLVDAGAVRDWMTKSIDDRTREARLERIPEAVKGIL